jgi:hypothetical protein
MDGDGDLDILGNANEPEEIFWIENMDGLGNFGSKHVISNVNFYPNVVFSADIDNDGDQDLIIASGGNEYRGDSEFTTQRIYLNDGMGNFDQKYIFEDSHMTASSLVVADFDGDGFQDVFFGGRAVPYGYGLAPGSKFYLNNQDGTFSLSNDSFGPFLNEMGMVTDADVVDLNGDGKADIILALEWESIQIMINEGDKFGLQEVGKEKGWWKHVKAGDFNGDGLVDIIAGNTGENSRFKPTEEQPVNLYIKDFDDNGQTDPLLTYYLGGEEIPFANHSEILKQLPNLKKEWKYAKDFSRADFQEVFGSENLKNAKKLSVNDFSSYYYKNNGDGTFKAIALPAELQISTLNSVEFINEKSRELLGAGNFYENNIEMGKYDAQYGTVFQIKDSNIEIKNVKNLRVDGQVRKLNSINVNGAKYMLVARNDQSLKLVAFEKINN